MIIVLASSSFLTDGMILLFDKANRGCRRRPKIRDAMPAVAKNGKMEISMGISVAATSNWYYRTYDGSTTTHTTEVACASTHGVRRKARA